MRRRRPIRPAHTRDDAHACAQAHRRTLASRRPHSGGPVRRSGCAREGGPAPHAPPGLGRARRPPVHVQHPASASAQPPAFNTSHRVRGARGRPDDEGVVVERRLDAVSVGQDMRTANAQMSRHTAPLARATRSLGAADRCRCRRTPRRTGNGAGNVVGPRCHPKRVTVGFRARTTIKRAHAQAEEQRRRKARCLSGQRAFARATARIRRNLDRVFPASSSA